MANNFNYEVSVNGNTQSIRRLTASVDNLVGSLTKTRGSSSSAGSGINEFSGLSEKATARIKALRAESDNLRRAQTQLAIVNGSAARQFSASSRLAGGLARSYAIVAASIFSVVTGFQQLEQADRTRVVLENMSRASGILGVSLSQLTNNLREVTQGAVSLAEASRLAAFAGAGGISPETFQRLSAAALGASQTLGINLTDAISRLTRGIIKGEVELLDELGIITRLDTLYNRYAESIGRTTAQLTDHQRSQARNLGVLEIAETLYGKSSDQIERQVPAVQRLSGVVSDLSTSTLNLLNSALNPVLEVLLDFPQLLTAIGVSLSGALISRIREASDSQARFANALAITTEAQARQLDSTEKARGAILDSLSTLNQENRDLRRNSSRLASNTQARAEARASIVSLREEYTDQRASLGRLNSEINIHRNRLDSVIASRSRNARQIESIRARIDALTATQMDYNENLRSIRREIIANRRESASLLQSNKALGSSVENLTSNVSASRDSLRNLRSQYAFQTRSLAAVTASSERFNLSQQISNTLQDRSIPVTARLTSSLGLLSNSIRTTNAAYARAIAANEGYRASLLRVSATVAVVRTGITALGAVASTAFAPILAAFTAISIGTAVFSGIGRLLSNNTKEVERFRSELETTAASQEDYNKILERTQRSLESGRFDLVSASVLKLNQGLQSQTKQLNSLSTAYANTVKQAGIFDRALEALTGGNRNDFINSSTEALKRQATAFELSGNASQRAAAAQLRSRLETQRTIRIYDVNAKMFREIAAATNLTSAEVAKFTALFASSTEVAAENTEVITSSTNSITRLSQTLSKLPSNPVRNITNEFNSLIKNIDNVNETLSQETLKALVRTGLVGKNVLNETGMVLRFTLNQVSKGLEEATRAIDELDNRRRRLQIDRGAARATNRAALVESRISETRAANARTLADAQREFGSFLSDNVTRGEDLAKIEQRRLQLQETIGKETFESDSRILKLQSQRASALVLNNDLGRARVKLLDEQIASERARLPIIVRNAREQAKVDEEALILTGRLNTTRDLTADLTRQTGIYGEIFARINKEAEGIESPYERAVFRSRQLNILGITLSQVLESTKLPPSLFRDLIKLRREIIAAKDEADVDRRTTRQPQGLLGGLAAGTGFTAERSRISSAAERDAGDREGNRGPEDAAEAVSSAIDRLSAQEPALGSLIQAFGQIGGAAVEAFNNIGDGAQAAANRTRAVGGILAGVGQAVAGGFQLSNRAISRQIQFLQKYGDNSEQTQATIRKLEEEREENTRKSTIAQIIGNTALGVASALAIQPFTPANFALAGVVGALGATQLALATSAFSGGNPSIPKVSAPSRIEVGRADRQARVDVSQRAQRVERSALVGDRFNSTGSPISFRQAGGEVSAGNPVVLGDRGAEIFVPRVDGDVISNAEAEESRALPTQVNLNVSAMDASTFVDFLQRGGGDVVSRFIEQRANSFGESLVSQFNTL